MIAFAPYFGEYRSLYDTTMMEFWLRFPLIQYDFQPKLDEFEQKITPKTKAVIVNTSE